MTTPKLPEGFKWDLRECCKKGFLLVLLPEEGYTWDFPLCTPLAEPTSAFYATHVKNPKVDGALHEAARVVLSESLGPTTVIKPKVRRIDVR